MHSDFLGNSLNVGDKMIVAALDYDTHDDAYAFFQEGEIKELRNEYYGVIYSYDDSGVIRSGRAPSNDVIKKS